MFFYAALVLLVVGLVLAILVPAALVLLLDETPPDVDAPRPSHGIAFLDRAYWQALVALRRERPQPIAHRRRD